MKIIHVGTKRHNLDEVTVYTCALGGWVVEIAINSALYDVRAWSRATCQWFPVVYSARYGPHVAIGGACSDEEVIAALQPIIVEFLDG